MSDNQVIDIEQKKQYISKMTNDKSIIDILSKEDFIEIGNKIIRANKGSMIKYSKAGAKINIDLIKDNDNLINEIYTFINYKIDKNKQKTLNESK